MADRFISMMDKSAPATAPTNFHSVAQKGDPLSGPGSSAITSLGGDLHLSLSLLTGIFPGWNHYGCITAESESNQWSELELETRGRDQEQGRRARLRGRARRQGPNVAAR